MRLSVLDHGHRRRARLFLALTSMTSRVDSPDIVKMLLYRPAFLTRPLLELTADAMRGPSYWTAGEREYLAMRTAQLHRCPFCVESHAELTRIAGHGEIDPDDPASARPQLRAVREFLDLINSTAGRGNAGEAIARVADLPEHAVERAVERGDLSDRDLARQVIARAPEDQRAIAWLYHVDGFDQDEVARVMSVSRRTVVNKLAAFSANARKYITRAA
jgi:AhpD family alkylhydroperoxidase